MNEAELSAAIAAGTAPSPSRFGNSTYFALRISGTGIADRPALEEVCYRCPDVWTSPEMIARTNGLPIVFGHPGQGSLTSSEYVARNIGAAVMPYVLGSELWAVARICDDDGAAAMASGEFSTSPMVTLSPDVAVTIEGENKLVIEGDPATLDHVAIVQRGVWDKGGLPSGIRLDSKKGEAAMADEMTEEERKEEERKEQDRKDATAGEEKPGDDAMKTLMASLGGIGDALTSLGKRMDKLETQKSERADSLESRLDAVNALHAPRNTGEAMRQEVELAGEQHRADQVEQAWGRSAPRFHANETPRAYIIRSLHPHKPHSAHWKDFDLSTLPIEGLRVAAEQIRADSIVASANPAAPPDQLVKRTRDSGAGHKVSEYFGDVHVADAPFRIMPRLMTFRDIPRGM